MSKLISLSDLFHLKILLLVRSERRIADGYPQMAGKCHSPDLQAFLRERAVFACNRANLLEEMHPGLEECSMPPSPVKTVMEEGEYLIGVQGESTPAVLDATIASVVYSIGHLNLASYGSAHAYALLLKRSETLLLYQLLRGEIRAERELSRLMEVILNPSAAEEEEKGELDSVLIYGNS